MLYTIYQNKATRKHSDLINTLGWDGSANEEPSIATHLEMSFIDEEASNWKPEFINHYEPVASVHLSDVGGWDDWIIRVIHAGNKMPAPNTEYSNFNEARSLSTGDIVRDQDGQFFISNGYTLVAINVEQL